MYEPVPKALLDGVEAARTTLHAGYTAVREIAAREYLDVFLRDAQRKGQIDGPRMLATGPGVYMTGGHGSFFKEEEAADSPVGDDQARSRARPAQGRRDQDRERRRAGDARRVVDGADDPRGGGGLLRGGTAARPADGVPRDGRRGDRERRARGRRHGRARLVHERGELPADDRARHDARRHALERGRDHPQRARAVHAVGRDDGRRRGGRLRPAHDGGRARGADRDGLGLRRQRVAPARSERARARVLRALRDDPDAGDHVRHARRARA